MDLNQPFEADAMTADRPGRRRDSLFLLANLRRTGERDSVPVRVRNLSPGGLMAEVAGPFAADAAIEIEVRGIGWISGRIAWHTEGRAGIAFDRPVDPQAARKPVSGNPPRTGGKAAARRP